MENNSPTSRIPRNRLADTSERNLLTACLFIAFIILGAVQNIMGPTLVHLGYLFGEDIAKMSLAFSCFSVGYIIGPILTGLLFERFNPLLQFFILYLFMGSLLAAVPWMPNIYLFYFVWTLFCTLMGYFDSSAQPYPIRLWFAHKFQQPIAQCLCSLITVGALIQPFIAKPFLIELPTIAKENSTIANSSEVDDDHFRIGNKTEVISGNVPDKTISMEGIEMVRYPYAISGLVLCSVSFCFLFVYVFSRCRTSTVTRDPDEISTKENSPHQPLNVYQEKSFKMVFLSFNAMFSFFLLITLCLPLGFLPAFVMKGLNWSVEEATLVSSLYAAMLALGRILGIPISRWVKARTMIQVDLAITIIAFILLSLVSPSRSSLVWISAVLAGLGGSTTFPSLLIWTSTFFPITGRNGAIFFISGSFGLLSSTALTGYLFENYTHMWVAYICLPAVAMEIMLHSGLLIFIKCYQGKLKKKNMT